VLSLAAPHAGPALLTGTADLAGFVHRDLREYSNFSFFGFNGGVPQWGAEGTGIAYSERTAPHARYGAAPAAI
jgi:hypothetical protein